MLRVDWVVQKLRVLNGTAKVAWPMHTFKADIDYGMARANTTYGVIGVKVWIYRGDVTKLEKSDCCV